MGEEDLLEPTEAREVEAENVTIKAARKRKKQLHTSIRDLMEFWFSDANLQKDNFLSQMISMDPWVDLEVFLTFNKLKALTQDVDDIVKALRKSEMLKVSENQKNVCRITPLRKKSNEDACTIYVEQILPDAEHDWLKAVFSEFGPIDYISLPRFKATQKPKGFAFIEFKTPESANKAVEAFKTRGCCLSPQMDPDKLVSIATFVREESMNKSEKKGNLIFEEVKEEVNEEVNEEVKDTESVDKDDETVKDKQKRRKSSNSKTDHEDEEVSEQKLDDDNDDDGVKERRSNKRKRKMSSTNEPVIEDDVDEDKPLKRSKPEETEGEAVKTKKKKTPDDSLEVEESEQTNVEDAVVLENVEEGECEGDKGEDGERKKKRKRKKKHRKNINPLSYGLQIMPKVEWRHLRNKYLNLQKEKMKQLKKQLGQNQWGQRTPKWQPYTYYEDDDVTLREDIDDKVKKEKSELKFISGVIIKVSLDNRVRDVKGVKISARISPHIRYVDATEGDDKIYLRVSAPELAQKILTDEDWRFDMELLQGGRICST